MKKIFILALVCLMGTSVFASDSTRVDSTKMKIKLNTSLTFMSRNYSRGINYGDGVSIQPTIEASYKGFTLGMFGALSDNKKYNYGSTFDTYITYSIDEITLGVHDFFYANKIDSLNDFLFKTGKNSGLDGHYLEAQLKFNSEQMNILFAYNFYNTTCDINYQTVYMEGECKFKNGFSCIFGFTSGPSNLNFYTDKYNEGIGFTCVGVNWLKKIQVSELFSTDLKVQAHVNPNYRNITSGLQSTPYNMIVSLTF